MVECIFSGHHFRIIFHWIISFFFIFQIPYKHIFPSFRRMKFISIIFTIAFCQNQKLVWVTQLLEMFVAKRKKNACLCFILFFVLCCLLFRKCQCFLPDNIIFYTFPSYTAQNSFYLSYSFLESFRNYFQHSKEDNTKKNSARVLQI